MTRLTATLAVVAFLLLSWSDHHHWDEFLYLHSASVFSPRELMQIDGVLNFLPPGYLAGKIGHLAILHGLVRITGRGRTALLVLQGCYAALLLATVAAARAVYRELTGDDRLAGRAALVLLFLPLSFYLSFKLLSEIPSLLLTTLASWMFLRAFRAHARRSIPFLLGASTCALAAGMACRVTAPLGYVGLVLGLSAAGRDRFPRARVLQWGIGVGLLALALHAFVLGMLGGSELQLVHLAAAVVGKAKWFQRMYAVIMFFQLFLLVLPFALWRPWSPALRVALVWLLVTVLPNLTGHEPRYYVPAVLPLAILGAFGIDRLSQWFPATRSRWAWGLTLAGLVLVDRAALFDLMPFEVEQRDLARTAEVLGTRGTILVPWVTDYCFLRFVFPHLPVRLTVSARPGGRYRGRGHVGPIAPSDQAWADPARYVGDLSTLAAAPQPWSYLAWSYNPVMLRIGSLLGGVGITMLGDPRQTGWHDHRAESWIWDDPRLVLRQVGARGQYEVYRIQYAGSAESP